MSNDFPKEVWEQLNLIFAEHHRWAKLSVTIGELAKENKSIVRDLSQYDPTSTIPLLASLLTIPKLQSHCIRLEILLVLAVGYCHGTKKADTQQVRHWFSQIGKSQCVIGEDPAEDVFISIVHDAHGDYRLFEGVWESAGFYTQRVLDVIALMPDTAQFEQIRRSVRALLIISDMVCDNARLHRYQLGSDRIYSTLSPHVLKNCNSLRSRVTISIADLNKRGIIIDDIEPFILQPRMIKDLPTQRFGLSSVDRYPLIMYDKNRLIVALSSALSVAMRDYIITEIIRDGLVSDFDNILAKNYTKLFFETPLLGGPLHAPVH